MADEADDGRISRELVTLAEEVVRQAMREGDLRAQAVETALRVLALASAGRGG